MPIYDLHCHCGKTEEVRLPYFDSPVPACECGGERSKMVCAPGGFIMPGNGTYDRGFVSKKAPQ